LAEIPTHGGWWNVPAGLMSKTQLADLDLPRVPGGPVRADVETENWRGKKDVVSLYRLDESTPSNATMGQLESARARSTTLRVCGDCGARPDRPPAVSADGPVARCTACATIARLRAAQNDVRSKRAAAIDWARTTLAPATVPALVMHVEEVLRPAAPSGRQSKNPIAYRVDAVNTDGAVVLAATVRATVSNVRSMPVDAVHPRDVADQLARIAGAELVVTWDAYDVSPLHRLAGVERPKGWYGGNPNLLRHWAAWWRADINPLDCTPRTAVPPGRADRMLLLLRRMANTEA
jgi:hypothetical protein